MEWKSKGLVVKLSLPAIALRKVSNDFVLAPHRNDKFVERSNLHVVLIFNFAQAWLGYAKYVRNFLLGQPGMLSDLRKEHFRKHRLGISFRSTFAFRSHAFL